MVSLVLEGFEKVWKKNRERFYNKSEDVRRSGKGRCARDCVVTYKLTKKCTNIPTRISNFASRISECGPTDRG